MGIFRHVWCNFRKDNGRKSGGVMWEAVPDHCASMMFRLHASFGEAIFDPKHLSGGGLLMALEVRDCFLAVLNKIEPHFPCYGTLLQASFLPNLIKGKNIPAWTSRRPVCTSETCSFEFIGFQVDPNQKQDKVEHNSRQLVFSFADNGSDLGRRWGISTSMWLVVCACSETMIYSLIRIGMIEEQTKAIRTSAKLALTLRGM